jgi:hypothetical protein
MPTRETLAQRQRRLLAAVKGRASDGTWFATEELALLRETLLWWRRLGIMQACRFTPTLLAVQGRLEASVAAFVRDSPGADGIEAQRDLFLAHAAHDGDVLCAAVAATEAALLAARENSNEPARAILWCRDPEPVFAALLRGELPPQAFGDPFVVTVGPNGHLEWHRAEMALNHG